MKQPGSGKGKSGTEVKNGEFYPEWLTISLIRDEKGNIINHVAVFSDISKRVQAEEKQHELQRQLQHAQKMESLGQLTGGIAHDFNNMLASIMGYTDLARMLVTRDEHGKLPEYLDQVYCAGERARDLIAQMLTFSRGSSNGEKQPLRLEPAVKDAIKMLRPMLSSSIKMNVSINDDLPVVNADPVQLHQIIMNLCINARDAMDDKGKIDVTLSVASGVDTICNSCHQPVSGDYIEVVVADNGSGIKPKIIEQLFEPFFTTKDIGKGTGMGLAMVHGIMHDHSGHIIVNSTLGEGTEFRLLFPFEELVAKTETKQGDLKTEWITGNNQHILIVDDEESIARFMKILLESHEYRVSIFKDSVKALASFQENPNSYALVITDQTMPDITGEEMARSMLQVRPDLPIILCTGYSSRIDKENAESIGIKAYMEKPMNTKDILQTVNALLSH
ncbi:MAG: ATP-binding protein [Methylococcales bacterium]